MHKCRFQKGSFERYELPMEVKRKPTALFVAGALAGWELLLKPVWTLNVERVAEQQNIDKALVGGWRVMDALQAIIAYIPSSFALGFAAGAVIFAYWDTISTLFRKRVLKRVEEEPSPIRAWVGNMLPAFDAATLRDQGCATIYITMINVGTAAYRLASIKGHIAFAYDDGSGKRRIVKLPTPSFSHDPAQDPAIPFAHYTSFLLYQPIPATVAKAIPEAFGWKPYPSMDFEELVIELESEDGKHKKRLALWDGVILKGVDHLPRASQYTRVKRN